MAALVSIAERAAAMYREFGRLLRRDAYQAAAADRPLTARRLRYWAIVAEAAAAAELAPKESLP